VAASAKPEPAAKGLVEQITADIESAYDPFGGWLGGY
jgi:hypothetical protein